MRLKPWEGNYCKGFHVFRKEVCQPLRYDQHNNLFSVDLYHRTLEYLNDSHMIQIWNDFSTNMTFDVSKRTPLIALARKICPKVFGGIKENF